MKGKGIFAAVAAAVTLTVGTAFAEADMEKCKVVDKDGKGLIKEHKGDCKTAVQSCKTAAIMPEAHSCAGGNAAHDPEAWIFVPKGQCAKINAGDFTGISQEIKDKIEGAK